jgi:hypothetical protein
MNDWDDSDNAPKREMIERSCARAGWLIATGGPNDTDAGELCLKFPLPNKAALFGLEAVDSLRPPLYGETIAVGQWRAIHVYDADGKWLATDHEWMGEDDDAPEGSHAWTLTFNTGPKGVTGYRLEPSVTPAPVAVLTLLNALNAEIRS